LAEEEGPPVIAYLDTSILANWLIYYRKRKRWLSFKEKDGARQSMELLQGIIADKYNADFKISAWTIGELVQSALDNVVAVRMIRDGRNPRFFQTMKEQYPLSNEEKNQIGLSIEDFLDKIERLDIRPVGTGIEDYSDMRDFAFNYGIEAPDALHLSIAGYLDCEFFLTTDKRLIDKKIKEIQVMLPPTFDRLPYVRRRSKEDG